MTLQTILSKAVKAGIVENGLSQKSLASKVGLTEKHLSMMLTGKSTGSVEAWDALLDVSGARVGFKIDQL